MAAHAQRSDLAEDGTLFLTRVFDAPREALFEAWTVPEQFARWFGPRGVETHVRALDPRPGGVIHFAHRFPDGDHLWVKGVFLEVVKTTRLVFTSSFVNGFGHPTRHPMFADWPLEAVLTTTVTFEDDAHGTRLTIHQTLTPETAASHPAVVRERSLAHKGWLEVLDHLDGFISDPGDDGI